jgi:hypothetical protein
MGCSLFETGQDNHDSRCRKRHGLVSLASRWRYAREFADFTRDVSQSFDHAFRM